MRGSEQQAERWLRALILVIVALGVVAGFDPHGYMRGFVLAFNLPAAWAYVRPRWPLITVWIMWGGTWAMLATFMRLGGTKPVLATTGHWLMAASTALLCVALPLVRLTLGPRKRPDPSRIPEARVHVRD